MTKTDPLPHWSEIAVEAALKGGAVLKKYWGNLTVIKEKEYPGDLVTEADRQSEQAVLAHLKKSFPDHQLLAEESGLYQPESSFLWAVDPLDGTTNYTHQYPMAAVSIGLVADGEPLIGVIYNPFSNEMFRAAKGCGAKLNDQPIKVSVIETLGKSLLATGFAYDRRETKDNNYAEFCRLTNLTQGVRRAGAASLDLAYVACGRLDGYWERGLKPWDVAAGIILVREAGGAVTNYDLKPVNINSGRILASNGLLQTAISQELQLLASSG